MYRVWQIRTHLVTGRSGELLAEFATKIGFKSLSRKIGLLLLLLSLLFSLYLTLSHFPELLRYPTHTQHHNLCSLPNRHVLSRRCVRVSIFPHCAPHDIRSYEGPNSTTYSVPIFTSNECADVRTNCYTHTSPVSGTICDTHRRTMPVRHVYIQRWLRSVLPR